MRDKLEEAIEIEQANKQRLKLVGVCFLKFAVGFLVRDQSGDNSSEWLVENG